MAGPSLPVNVDVTYADDAGDTSVKTHQQHHDTIHSLLNLLDTIVGYPVSTLTNSQAGTAYTLALSDAGKIVELTNAAAVTLAVPTNATVAFPVGTVLTVRQYGTGQVTVGGAGVTLRSRGGALKTAGQYAELALAKRATDEWVVVGDVTT